MNHKNHQIKTLSVIPAIWYQHHIADTILKIASGVFYMLISIKQWLNSYFVLVKINATMQICFGKLRYCSSYIYRLTYIINL